MRKVLLALVFALQSLIGTEVNAAPCTSASFASYAGLGSAGCEIGSFRFSDFAPLSSPAGSSPFADLIVVDAGGIADPPMLVKGGIATPITRAGGGAFYVVPANAGPRMMNYAALFAKGTYATNLADVKVFAGTTDDPFWIDLGAAFDTFNLRSVIAPGVLSPAQDAALVNLTSDTVSGYAVNSIAIELPVSLLTRTGSIEPAGSPSATIGVWATTSRPRLTVRRAPLPAASSGAFSQIQRMGNPLINELLIGVGSKDRFSMDHPRNDSQFASFFLDPLLARVLNAATGGALAIPTPPRTDLLPLVTYAPPIAAPGTPVNDAPYRTSFPYLADAPSGRDRRHLDPGEPGCTAGSGAACAP